jgi:hypothetical protein
MCAFIDDLLDAFGDDVEFGTAKSVHPYLPKTSSEITDEAPHDKLSIQLATKTSEDDLLTSPAEIAPSPSGRPYLPSPTRKHHRYLPLPNAPEQLAGHSKQEKAEIASDVAISLEADRDVPKAIQEKAKPFRRNNSLHSYLLDAGKTEQGSLDSSSLVDERQDKDLESRDKRRDNESVVMKLDIDAMLAALPPQVAEVENVATCRTPKYSTREMILEANPELHSRMSAFLCEPRCLSELHATDMRFCVLVR